MLISIFLHAAVLTGESLEEGLKRKAAEDSDQVAKRRKKTMDPVSDR